MLKLPLILSSDINKIQCIVCPNKNFSCSWYFCISSSLSGRRSEKYWELGGRTAFPMERKLENCPNLESCFLLFTPAQHAMVKMIMNWRKSKGKKRLRKEPLRVCFSGYQVVGLSSQDQDVCKKVHNLQIWLSYKCWCCCWYWIKSILFMVGLQSSTWLLRYMLSLTFPNNDFGTFRIKLDSWSTFLLLQASFVKFKTHSLSSYKSPPAHDIQLLMATFQIPSDL